MKENKSKDTAFRGDLSGEVAQAEEKKKENVKGRGRLGRIFGDIKDRFDRDLEKNDPIYSEPIHPIPEPENTGILVKSGIDKRFLIYLIALLAFGAIMSFSASAVYAEKFYGDSAHFFWKYLLYAGISIAITVPFVIYATAKTWRYIAVMAFGGSIVLLILVLLIGVTGGGAKRWIEFGGITIQPSEIAKMALVMMLALYMSSYEKEVASRHKFGGSFKHGVLMPGIMVGLVCGLVALEKHISGLLILGMLGIAVMYMGGTRLKWIVLIGVAVALAGVMLVIVSDYAHERVQIWLDIESVDPLGPAWQTLQGLYAIGSGGIFGRGLGNSLQKYGYVSEPQNDFVFTIICEELGLVGAALVLILFALVIFRGFKIASKAPDKFTSLVVSGLSFKLALQTILNIAVVTNSMPNTGVSLPFFSSGGTFLAIQIFEMGIILSISRFSIQKR